MSEPTKDVSFEELRERLSAYLEPIPGASPGGTNAKFEPAYEAVAREVGKLDSPTGGAVNWPEIVQSGGDLLKKTTKDLLLSVWIAQALYSSKGLEGLVEGTTLLAALLDRYWDSLFPEPNRLRARANALGWLLDRVNMTLPTTAVTAQDKGSLAALGVTAKKLAEIAREKFAGSGPAFGPFLENIERLRLSLPADAPPPPPPPPPKPPEPAAASMPTAASSSPPPSSGPTAGAAPSTAPPLEAAPAFDPGGDVLTYLRNVGTNLLSAAGHLRRANTADPLAYRLLRTGLWLHMAQPPGGVTSGKTPAPPLAPTVRTRLEQMAGNGRFAELLEEAESALTQARFSLDLHRFSAVALAQLGPSHAAARLAVLAELGSLLRRMPALPQLLFSDGSPFADPQTKTWIDAEVSPSKAGAGGGSSDDPVAKILDEARELAGSGKAPDAISHLQANLGQVASAESRFKLRLALAETAFGAGHTPLARALYDALDKEIQARGLDEWQPALAVRALEGHVQCLRTLARAGKGLVEPGALTVIYDRLSRLDPSAALRLGSGA